MFQAGKFVSGPGYHQRPASPAQRRAAAEKAVFVPQMAQCGIGQLGHIRNAAFCILIQGFHVRKADVKVQSVQVNLPVGQRSYNFV